MKLQWFRNTKFGLGGLFVCMQTEKGENNSFRIASILNVPCPCFSFICLYFVFQRIKKFWIWPMLKGCIGELNVFLSVCFFCVVSWKKWALIYLFKASRRLPVPWTVRNLAKSARLSSVNTWARLLKRVPGLTLLGHKILGQQRVTLCVCSFQFLFCIKDTKKTAILAYACVVRGRS